MNFKKIARDRLQRPLEEGDIFMVPDGDDTTIAVVRRIIRHGRDTFPDLEITKFKTDWKGKTVESENEVMVAAAYRLSRRVDPSQAREDVPKWAQAKQLHNEIIAAQKVDKTV